MKRKFHQDGTLPENYEVFVFGSNLAGKHGGGAAKVAHEQFAAEWGHGVGMTGRTYAIPTKDENIETLPLNIIRRHVNDFVQFAKDNPTMDFFVTGVGCGLAGYTPEQIAPMFYEASDNCNFPDNWESWLTDVKTINSFQEWATHFLNDVLPQMEESSFVVSIAPSTDGGDVKYWTELGASIMLNKPIIVVSIDGADVPDKLRLVADEVVIIDGDLQNPPPDLAKAIERVKAKVDGQQNT